MPVPYADVDRFKESVDERLLAELGIDTDNDGVVDSNNVIIEAALVRASHETQSYALRGGIYTEVDLDNLQAAGNWLLIGTVCDIALGILFARRGGPYGESVRDRLDRANRTLIDLRDGMKIFPIGANIDASKPMLSIMSTQQRGALGMVADSAFFPQRRPYAV